MLNSNYMKDTVLGSKQEREGRDAKRKETEYGSGAHGTDGLVGYKKSV